MCLILQCKMNSFDIPLCILLCIYWSTAAIFCNSRCFLVNLKVCLFVCFTKQYVCYPCRNKNFSWTLSLIINALYLVRLNLNWSQRVKTTLFTEFYWGRLCDRLPLGWESKFFIRGLANVQVSGQQVAGNISQNAFKTLRKYKSSLSIYLSI